MIKICCIFNSAPHYRGPIYRLMDKTFNCHFYFGDYMTDSIEQICLNELGGFKNILPIKPIPHTGFEWQKGIIGLALKHYKYFIITGTPGSLSNWVLVILARLQGKKVYAWTHGMKGSNTRFGTFIEKNFYRLCNKILLYGEYSREVMFTVGFKPDKLVPIYNSLDLMKQKKVLDRLKTSRLYVEYFKNENPVLAYIGRIQKLKKLDQLIQAVNLLKERGHLVNVVLIGAITDASEIPALVESYKLEEQVWFYGPCYEEERIGKLLFNADVLVAPGPIGLTALHAATYGVPIVTHDQFNKQMPEFEVIQPDVTGSFFKEDDVEDLCDKILRWIHLEAEERNSVRISSLELIEAKYNPVKQLETLKRLIR